MIKVIKRTKGRSLSKQNHSLEILRECCWEEETTASSPIAGVRCPHSYSINMRWEVRRSSASLRGFYIHLLSLPSDLYALRIYQLHCHCECYHRSTCIALINNRKAHDKGDKVDPKTCINHGRQFQCWDFRLTPSQLTAPRVASTRTSWLAIGFVFASCSTQKLLKLCVRRLSNP